MNANRQPEKTQISTPSLLKYSFMCENIEVGDTIQYKSRFPLGQSECDECITEARVAVIRLELDCVTKKVLLNNGDTIINSLHLVQRISMMNIYTGQPLWNPIKDWFELSNFYMFPTEDAADLTPAHSIMEPQSYAKRDELIQYAYLERKNSRMKSQYKRKADATKRVGDIESFFPLDGPE